MQQREVQNAIRWAVSLAGCAAASFLVLDRQTHEPLYRLAQSPPVYWAVSILISFGKATFPLLAFAALWLYGFLRRSAHLKRAARIGITAQAAAGGLVWMLKLNIYRERPYVPYHQEGGVPVGYFQSFPSGDAAVIFAFAFAASYAFPRARPAFFAFAGAVAAMRVFRLAHYPSDVFAGAAAGAAGWAIALVATSWKEKRLNQTPSEQGQSVYTGL